MGAEWAKHRRRKMLDVEGAEDTIAREAHVKFSRARPLWIKPRPFLHDPGYCTIQPRVSRRKNEQ